MTSSKLVNFFRDYNKFYNIGPNATRRIFDDKLLFSAFLTGIGIRTPVSSWIVANDIAFNSSGQRIPTSALIPLLSNGSWFVKRRSGSGGRGALMLNHGTITKADGSVEAMSEASLVHYLKDDRGFLIQEIVVQSDEYAVFSPSSLNTVRCLTFLGQSREPEVAAVSLRMGNGRSVVDNDGIYCGVDLKTHRLLGPGLTDDDDGFAVQIFEKHPVSDVTLPGHRLNRLNDIFEVCKLAHQALGGPMTIGWDVAMTDAGPCIMEGNLRWGAALHSLVDPGVKERLWALFLRDCKLSGTGFPTNLSNVKRDNLVTVVFRVKGKVQGVGYRKWVESLAEEKGLYGQAKNRANGDVEITLTGPLRPLEFTILAAADGPRNADVSGIEIVHLTPVDLGKRATSFKKQSRVKMQKHEQQVADSVEAVT
ncbi:sugar-transfer associated ATP-grasp domain-containing protein [Microvirga sp. 2YAF29]|uniref:sugar-transfer associated ATP-grasp domain-containing protein n=1 Tax=Microvirga sp. 2YAF29 TaxID=3233031 RepID=UPI003F96865A